MEASPERDVAVGEYASRVSREDPAAAGAWVDTLELGDLQNEAIVEVARDWIGQDQEAAQTWIESKELFEDAIKQINEPSRDNGREVVPPGS